MRTSSEMAAALKAHQAKYPLRLGGHPIHEYFKLKAEQEEKLSDAADVASVGALSEQS